jgi:hypothetical protein
MKDENELDFALRATVKLVHMLIDVNKDNEVTHPLWVLKVMNRLH